MLKLRDSKPSAGVASPRKQYTTTRSILVSKLMKEFEDSVPMAHRAHYNKYIASIVDSALHASSSPSLESMRKEAREAATKLGAAAAAVAAPPAPRPPAATAPVAVAARRSVEEELLAASPRAATARPSSTTSRTSSIAALSTLRAHVPEAAVKAMETIASRLGSDIPMPQAFRKREGQLELRTGFKTQVAEHDLRRERESMVESMYGDVTKGITERAAAAEERILAKLKLKRLSNAEHVRMTFEAKRKDDAAKHAEQLREEDALLRQYKAELDAAEQRAKEEREAERKRVAATIAENHRLQALRDEARAKAVEEEIRLQKAYAERVVAAEKAHKDKYKYIADRQELLAEMLLKKTEAARRAREAWEKKSEDDAAAKVLADAEDDKRRAEAKQKRIRDTTTVLRSMMKEKDVARGVEAEEDKMLAAHTRAAAAEFAAEQAELQRRHEEGKKTYYDDLRAQLAKRKELSAVPGPRAVVDGTTFKGTSLVLHTTSSDYDTESAFHGELARMATVNAPRGNNSDTVAPLLGFAAPFCTAVEAAAASSTRVTSS